MFKYDETNPKIATDTVVLNKAIKSVIGQSAKLGPRLHAVIVACALHSVEHKDASLLTNLYNGLGNSVNKKNGINIWVRKYTSLILKPDKAGILKFIGKSKAYTFDLAGEDNPFYDMPEVEAAAQPFDLMAMFNRLVTKAENKKDEITDATQVLLLSKLEAISKEFTPVAPAKA